MQARTLAALVTLALLSLTAMGAFLGVPRVQLSHAGNDVDHVALYQNGFAAIRLERSFSSPGGQQVLEFVLPTSTVVDSLHAEGDGVLVREMRTTLTSDPVLRAGDHLVLHLQGGGKQDGLLVQDDGTQLMLQDGDASLLVARAQVTTIEILDRKVDPSGPGSTVLSVLVEAAKGTHNLRLSYLAHGAGWHPNHILDPTSGNLTFFATLTGLQDWANVSLDLVAGNPRLAYSYDGDASRMAFTFSGGAGGSAGGAVADGYSSSVGPSTQMGDLRRYTYDGTVTLARGETVRLAVASGHVEVLRHYYQGDLGLHQGEWQGMAERYTVRNDVGEVLPAGPVQVYDDGQWLGADTLPALGKGEVGNITVSSSDEVKARVQVVTESSGGIVVDPLNGQRTQQVTTTYNLQVRNLRDTDVDTRITTDPGTYRTTVRTTNPTPTGTQGSQLQYDTVVKAGATVTDRIVVERIQNV